MVRTKRHAQTYDCYYFCTSTALYMRFLQSCTGTAYWYRSSSSRKSASCTLVCPRQYVVRTRPTTSTTRGRSIQYNTVVRSSCRDAPTRGRSCAGAAASLVREGRVRVATEQDQRQPYLNATMHILHCMCIQLELGSVTAPKPF